MDIGIYASTKSRMSRDNHSRHRSTSPDKRSSCYEGVGGVRSRFERLLTHTTRDLNGSDSDLKSINEEFAALRNKFLDLEAKLKVKNKGLSRLLSDL